MFPRHFSEMSGTWGKCYVYIWGLSDFHMQYVCTLTGVQKHRASYLYVYGRVHPGVPFISGSSWFLSALSLFKGLCGAQCWLGAMCIYCTAHNELKTTTTGCFPSCCSWSQWNQLVSWRDNVSTAVWGLRRITTIINCMGEWTTWPSKGLLMPESVAVAGRESWSRRKVGQDGEREEEREN